MFMNDSAILDAALEKFNIITENVDGKYSKILFFASLFSYPLLRLAKTKTVSSWKVEASKDTVADMNTSTRSLRVQSSMITG